MSTRCQILVNDQHGTPVYVYRHSDGYPDTEHGVIAALKPICEEFLRWRGWDPPYLAAHIVAGFIRSYQENNEQYCRSGKSLLTKESTPEQIEDRISQSKFLGHGIDTELHGDIEFLYIVKRGGIEVQKLKDWESREFVTSEFVEFEKPKKD